MMDVFICKIIRQGEFSFTLFVKDYNNGWGTTLIINYYHFNRQQFTLLK